MGNVEPPITRVRCAPRPWTQRDPETRNYWSCGGPDASTSGTFWVRCKDEAQAVQCSTRGCTRRSWNGQPGEACCRSCTKSGGASHGPQCEKAFKESSSQGAQVAFENFKVTTGDDSSRPEVRFFVNDADGFFCRNASVDSWGLQESKSL